jgi:hypothetical protein
MSRLCNSSSEHSEGEEGGPGSFDVADFVGDNFERKGGGVDGLVVASDTVVGFDSSEGSWRTLTGAGSELYFLGVMQKLSSNQQGQPAETKKISFDG